MPIDETEFENLQKELAAKFVPIEKQYVELRTAISTCNAIEFGTRIEMIPEVPEVPEELDPNDGSIITEGKPAVPPTSKRHKDVMPKDNQTAKEMTPARRFRKSPNFLSSASSSFHFLEPFAFR